ncbi:MAG: hypothetical protein JO041_14605, partial [Acidobacteria bacterium]|nr:hypothetical protein [Acidobacteriota bacterium]
LALKYAHPVDMDLSLAQLGLARTYVAMGDAASARKQYQDLITLWKDANPGLPLVNQVKAEYAKLQ